MAGRTQRSLLAEEAFRGRLGELGATLIEPGWLGAREPHHVACALGHDCWPRPDGIRRGRGICRTCVGHSPQAAWAAFRARLSELGAECLEPTWLGNSVPHRVRCPAGHECQPRPDSVQRGQGVCRVCARNDPATTEARFRAVLAEMGAVLLEPKWLGATKPHHIRCAAGHDCYPQPGGALYSGRRICRTCSRRDPAATEAAFRAILAEQGAELLERYHGSGEPHRVRCASGHECKPRPHTVLKGLGICRACAGQDPAISEASFRAALAELGATLLEPYVNSATPHHVRCAEGHNCYPRPGVVRRGHGICHECAYRTWDVFYVVAHESEPRVKFGISNMSGKVRLRTHRRYGYTTVERLVTGLPGRLARNTEDAVRAALAGNGNRPVQGREYFDASCLRLILDTADSWLARGWLPAGDA